MYYNCYAWVGRGRCFNFEEFGFYDFDFEWTSEREQMQFQDF